MEAAAVVYGQLAPHRVAAAIARAAAVPAIAIQRRASPPSTASYSSYDSVPATADTPPCSYNPHQYTRQPALGAASPQLPSASAASLSQQSAPRSSGASSSSGDVSASNPAIGGATGAGGAAGASPALALASLAATATTATTPPQLLAAPRVPASPLAATPGKLVSAYSLWKHEQQHPTTLSTGCSVLDACLGGGVPVGSITEVSGEAGAGKTQLGLQLSLQVQLPTECGGLAGHAVYISSEGDVPVGRLKEMAASQQAGLAHDMLSRVHIHLASTVDEFSYILRMLPRFLKAHPIKLIVVDSIAALFRGDFTSSSKDLHTRSSLFFEYASTLKQLAVKHGLAILILNQVTASMSASDSPASRTRSSVPALGVGWSNCVNTRVMMWRSESYSHVTSVPQGSNTSSVRDMRLVFSPQAPPAECRFEVLTHGIRGCHSVLH